jgi:hypothetical protein
MKQETTELDSSGSGHGPLIDFFENGTEPSTYVKGRGIYCQMTVLTVSQDELCSKKLVIKEKLHRIQYTVCYKNRYIYRYINNQNC